MRPVDNAISVLNGNGYLNVQLDSQMVESVPPNTVIWQEPVPGAASFRVPTNGRALPRPPSVRERIRLVVSVPPVNQGRVVPDVRDWRTLDAMIHLRVLGLPAVMGDPAADPRETFVAGQAPDAGLPVEQLDDPTVLLEVRPYPVLTQVRVDTVRDTVTVSRTRPAPARGLPLPTAIGLATAVLALGIVAGYAGTTSGWLRPGRSATPPSAPEAPAEAPPDTPTDTPSETPPEAHPAAHLRLPHITTAIVDEAVWATKKRVSRVEVTREVDR